MKQQIHLLLTAAALGFAGSISAATISSFQFTTGSASSSDTETLTTTSNVTAAGSGLTGINFVNDQLEVGGDQTLDGGSRTLDTADNIYFAFDIVVPTEVTLSLDQIAFDFGYNNSFRLQCPA